MTKEQIQKVQKLKDSGLSENVDFRVIYFGIYAEIKFL